MSNMTETRREKIQLRNLSKNTYDARRSKRSISSVKIGDFSATACCKVELEEANSSTRFLFLSKPVSSGRAGGSDVDELVSSSDSSASSPS
jgi:hypothetical protein